MATGVLCAFALLATPPSSSVRETAETKLVEYFNGTLSIPKPRVESSALVSKAKGCLGSPPCSAHGKCHESKSASGGFSTFSCKCEGGYFLEMTGANGESRFDTEFPITFDGFPFFIVR